MTPLKLFELELAAKHCIPQGPWDYYLEQGCEGHGTVVTYTEDEKGMRSLKDSVFKRIVAPEETKRFLAHANPDTVLKLCQALRTVVYHLEKYEAIFTGPSQATEALTEIRTEVDFE